MPPLGASARPPRRSRLAQEPAGPSALVVLLGCLLSLALIGGTLYAASYISPTLSRTGWLLVLGGIVVYVLAGHFVRVEPDMEDLGLFGGLVDNPLGLSDDYNRFLVFLQVVLLPGRLIAASLLGLGRLLFGRS